MNGTITIQCLASSTSFGQLTISDPWQRVIILTSGLSQRCSSDRATKPDESKLLIILVIRGKGNYFDLRIKPTLLFRLSYEARRKQVVD